MIKADGPAKVKALAAFLLLIATFSHAQTAAPPQQPPPDADVEQVKPIDAEEFHVNLRKKSTSGRVLLLEDPSENNPKPGKILLLKTDAADIVAVRVLKSYPRNGVNDPNQSKFAAKIVLPFQQPSIGSEYRALKKIGDKMMNMIREREKRAGMEEDPKSDEELAKEVNPDDNELDRGIPSPGKKVDDRPEDTQKKPDKLFDKEGMELRPEDVEVADEDEPYADLMTQEESPLEPHRHAISVEYASIRGVDFGNSSTSYSALGVRYGFNLINMAFFHRRTFQDVITIELGLFEYSASRDSPAQSVTVLPFIGTFRYNLFLGEGLNLFGYAGVMKNFVAQTEGGPTLSYFETTQSALGGGAMIRLGPGWAVRAEIGSDLFGVGVVLKF